MQFSGLRRSIIASAAVVAALIAPAARAISIEEDWTVYPIPGFENVTCGVVTAANVELIVLYSDGVMVIVSGADVVMEDLTVDADGKVFYRDEPAGIIGFADDMDGAPTLFWLTLGGTVVQIDTFTGEPSDSGIFPDEIGATECDACELIDQSSLCGGNGGGNGNDNGNDNGNGGPIKLPILCGSGVPGAAALSMLMLPFVGRSARRRG